MATSKFTSKHRKTRASRGGKRGARTEEKLIELVRRKAQAYTRLPNVTSVGVGYRVVDGQLTNELAVQFTVGRKLGPDQLAALGMTRLPEVIVADDGTEVLVDVIERVYRPSYQIVKPSAAATVVPQTLTPEKMRRRRLGTIMPGISVSNVKVSVGTFGAVVYDALNGTPYILSNWHVLHGPSGQIGDSIVQPGTYDDSNTAFNQVGHLVRSHLGLAGDCAIASITSRALDERLLEMNVTPKRIGKASVGDRVVKSGRTTGVTYGIVTRTGVVVNMNYGSVTAQVGGFEIGPNPDKRPPKGEISDEGDSGCVWMVDTDGADKDVVLGLNFAGEKDPNPANEQAVACNIHSVCEKLQITFEG